MRTLAERVVEVVAQELGTPDAYPDDDLVHDLYMDSLDHVEIIMAVEEEFGIEITDEEAEACRTVQDVIDLVERATPTGSER